MLLKLNCLCIFCTCVIQNDLHSLLCKGVPFELNISLSYCKVCVCVCVCACVCVRACESLVHVPFEMFFVLFLDGEILDTRL